METKGQRFVVEGLTPYTLAVMLEDSCSKLSQEERAEFEQCCTPTQLQVYATETILALLAAVGITTSLEEIRRVARKRTAAWPLAEDLWHPRLNVPLTAKIECLLGLCAVELWRRALPAWPCAEMLGDRIRKGHHQRDAGDRAGALAGWLEVWEALQVRLRPELTPARMERVIDGPDDLWSWLDALSLELSIAVAGGQMLETALAFHRRVLELVPTGSSWTVRFRGRLGSILLLARRRDEAEAVLAPLVQRWPRDAAECLGLSETPVDGDIASLVRRLLQAGASLPLVVEWPIIAAGSAAVPHLSRLIEDPTLARRPGASHAATLLGSLRAPQAVEPLLRVLRRQGTEDPLGCACIWALQQMGAVVLERLLQEHESCADCAHRGALRRVLAGLGVRDDRIYALLLGEIVEDPLTAARNLSSYGDRRAVGPLRWLIRCLPGDDPELALGLTVAVGGAIVALGGELEPKIWDRPEAWDCPPTVSDAGALLN